LAHTDRDHQWSGRRRRRS